MRLGEGAMGLAGLHRQLVGVEKDAALAEPDFVSRFEAGRLADLSAVELGAVPGPQVLDPPTVVSKDQLGVLAGEILVVDL